MKQARKIAPNLALDEEVSRRIAAGESILHLGFGESRLPVYPGLAKELSEAVNRNAYGPVVGSLSARQAVAGYFERRGLPTNADQIVLGPGSKPLVLATIAALDGDVVVAKPSWVTYAPQVRLAGRTPIAVDIPEVCGGVPNPELLSAALRRARSSGLNPSILIQTSPDNPTGTIAPPSIIGELAHIAAEEDLIVLSDEIYGDITFDQSTPVVSPASVIPERTVVSTGLSKSLSLGGWRIGAARYPEGVVGENLTADVAAIASESWSNLAGPQQAVAEYAFNEPADLIEHRDRCTVLHSRVAEAVYEIFVARGARCRRPTGGFYVYPDLEHLREVLSRLGVVDSPSLERYLLAEYGVAVLGGHHFGDSPVSLCMRVATSMMYGATVDEQWETLTAVDPLDVPIVRDNLARIDTVLRALSSA